MGIIRDDNLFRELCFDRNGTPLPKLPSAKKAETTRVHAFSLKDCEDNFRDTIYADCDLVLL